MSTVWLEFMVEVSGMQVQNTPRFGWIDGAKVAVSIRGVTVEAT